MQYNTCCSLMLTISIRLRYNSANASRCTARRPLCMIVDDRYPPHKGCHFWKSSSSSQVAWSVSRKPSWKPSIWKKHRVLVDAMSRSPEMAWLGSVGHFTSWRFISYFGMKWDDDLPLLLHHDQSVKERESDELLREVPQLPLQLGQTQSCLSHIPVDVHVGRQILQLLQVWVSE